jgi:hypothetical protein
MASLERIHYDFTEEETALLEKRKLEWQATDKPGRRAIATQVYDKLKNDNPDWDNVKKKLKKDVCILQPPGKCGCNEYLLSGRPLVVSYLWQKTGISGTVRCSEAMERPDGRRR